MPPIDSPSDTCFVHKAKTEVYDYLSFIQAHFFAPPAMRSNSSLQRF